jgi:eukaryotic-like serine/threonine-protein kinase
VLEYGTIFEEVLLFMSEIPLLNNRYKLEETIGSGGMAVVYRSRDQMLERTVAIKLLREDFSKDPSFRERFRQEAMAAANLYHPNIVTIHDFGLDNGRFFIVMENVPGTDLKNMVVRRGRFPVDEAIDLMVQACAGIGYAHRAGLVHCDIKPHNILVTPDKRLKVADFGIARALAGIQPDEKSNVVWGSPQYFSPEQAAGKAPSPASDVYSLGVVMYEMLTGRLPFIATTATELARMHREVAPPSPSAINPQISAHLEQVLSKVLSKEPSSRYRTADQMGRVLMTIRRPTGSQVPVKSSSSVPVVPPIKTRPPPVNPVAPSKSDTISPPAVIEVDKGNKPTNLRDDNPFDIDWGTWALGLLALLAVAGLIPFWLWVYFTYNPPVR